MPEAPPQKQTPQQMFESLSWRLNNLDTKVRINEQNLLNMRRHSQLIVQNFLDLKKEIRNTVQSVQQDTHNLKGQIKELQNKLTEIESKLGGIQRGPPAKPKPAVKESPLKDKSADQLLNEILAGEY